MFKLRNLAMLFSVVVMVATLAMVQGCSESESPVEPVITEVVNPDNGSDEQLVTDLSLYNVDDRYEASNDGKRGSASIATGSWWGSLSQSRKNYQIVIEALYSVDRNIWGQNGRISNWNCYLAGGCPLMGNWPYSYRFPGVVGHGGTCKDFANELVRRASGWATSLPSGSDFIGVFPYRNKADAKRYAQAGEILQFIGPLHTAVIISNFHDGRFEVVDANWSTDYDGKIRKHVIDTEKPGSVWSTATLRSYVINH